jgi:hypothetical protein
VEDFRTDYLRILLALEVCYEVRSEGVLLLLEEVRLIINLVTYYILISYAQPVEVDVAKGAFLFFEYL